jgi:GMP synthase (glutamine-hydrolysing)
MHVHEEKILVLDFGSQYTQLIARRVRECKVYCEIHPFSMSIQRIREFGPKGIILSGGPASVYEEDAPRIEAEILDMGVPVLGICYGLQLMCWLKGGRVGRSKEREYGRAELVIDDFSGLFEGLNPLRPLQVWMSHGDRVEDLPPDFASVAHSNNSPYAAIARQDGRVFGVQFHPEVVHTEDGKTILGNFVHVVCGCAPAWTMKSFIESSVEEIRRRVDSGQIVCGVSGGIDSTVVGVLLHRAIGEQLHCVFIDNGLLRKNEAEDVVGTFREDLGIELTFVDASKRFLSRLTSVTDPEEKRKIIGNEFISVFEEEAKKAGKIDFLAQDTLYPDVIESVSFKGPSAKIKSHHNVGGLPEKMNLKLVEPLRELFKDEVRELGEELGIPERIVSRQPFPGPGLAVRIMGEVDEVSLSILREADALLQEELHEYALAHDLWQAFSVLLPVKTVGVMGDERTYENVIALRVVQSVDGMTADWVRLPYDLLGRVANRIINEVEGVNRVVYDVSSKPPSTIEWE